MLSIHTADAVFISAGPRRGVVCRDLAQAKTGTVSLGGELKVTGDWPLAEERAVDGGGTLTKAEWAAFGGTGVYRLKGGDFVQVSFATDDGRGQVLVIWTRMSAVTLGAPRRRPRQRGCITSTRSSTSICAATGTSRCPERYYSKQVSQPNG